MKTMIIEATAPTRIDLAGGTIDIWPLYLFHPGAMTVNFAISLYARCRIEARDDECVIIESRDRGLRFETSLDRLDHLATESRLELASKLVHLFRPRRGFHLMTESESPPGAGLGASSSLAIACIGALNRFVGQRYGENQFIQIAANVETTVIRVPAGVQDYYAALYGGASCLHFRPDGTERERLEVDAAALEERVLLCYTGEPHVSGTNNWEIFKTHIDGDAKLFELFEGIRDSAQQMRRALLANDWQQVRATMRAYYPKRKQLAPNITTPHMDQLVEIALARGAEAAKVCGAGGGGCIAFLCESGCRERVARALEEAGAEVLSWKFADQGLTVREL